MNVLDIWGLWSTNLLYIWGIWSATLQIFVNLPDIQGLWSLNLLDIRGLWSTNHLYICEYQGYSGQGLQGTNHLYICEHLWPMRRKSQGYLGPLTHKPPVYLRISGIFGARIFWYLQISWIFANLINIQGLKEHESPRYSRTSWTFLYHLEILNLLDNLESPGYWGSMKCKSTGYS